MEFLKNIENGEINYLDTKAKVNQLNWNAHPKFKGVTLKDLILGKDTHNHVSCHLVKIDPGHEIGEHIHEGRLELHEVVYGTGICLLGDKEITYRSGSLAVIPADIKHRVIAGADGLYILAKFFPALA